MANISIRLKIKSIYNSLSKKEKLVADYLLNEKNDVSKQSINDISDSLNIASSTIFQFSKKIGFNGFKDLKIALLLENNAISDSSIHENINSNDDQLAIANKVFDSNIKTLQDTKQILQKKDLIKASKLINNCNQLYFFGIGGSEIVAKDAYHKFLRSPIKVRHSTDVHIQLMEASLMNENDLAICISHTGKTKETIEIAKTIKETGAKLIVITSNKESSLAKLADIVFISISDEIEFHSEALSSRISQLTILDSLFVSSMFNNRDNAEKSLSKVREVIAENRE